MSNFQEIGIEADVKILKQLGNELIDTWIKHCTDEDLTMYNEEIMRIKKRYGKQGIKFLDFDTLSFGIHVIYKSHEYFIDLWPGADAVVWDHGIFQEGSE